MAEVLLAHRSAVAGLSLHVHSAGLVCDHEPAQPNAVEAMARIGLDLSHHRSRIVDRDMVEAADLVIAMETRHVREIAVLDDGSFDRTFTLPDLVSRAEAVGPRTDADMASWLAALAEGRSRSDMLRQDRHREVPDPMGGSRRAFRKAADQIAGLLDRFVALAWPEGHPADHHDLAHQPSPGST